MVRRPFGLIVAVGLAGGALAAAGSTLTKIYTANGTIAVDTTEFQFDNVVGGANPCVVAVADQM
jgi:hypothetical protein